MQYAPRTPVSMGRFGLEVSSNASTSYDQSLKTED
jgi:hypothetical protein